MKRSEHSSESLQRQIYMNYIRLNVFRTDFIDLLTTSVGLSHENFPLMVADFLAYYIKTSYYGIEATQVRLSESLIKTKSKGYDSIRVVVCRRNDYLENYARGI
jgi:hypothetical protein